MIGLDLGEYTGWFSLGSGNVETDGNVRVE